MSDGYQSPQGRELAFDDPVLVAEALDLCVDYRGDVTLRLHSGEEVVGYVFNQHPDATPPSLELYEQESPTPRRLEISSVAALVFSGRDTASGRSWEAWVKRWDEKQKALAEGRDIGDIEPKVEEL